MSNNTVKKGSLLIYLAALHVLLVFLLVKTDFIPHIKAKFGIDTLPNLHIQTMIQLHKAMDASVPDNAVIFLGDSITQGLATAAVTAYSVNYGIGTENTAQLIDNLAIYTSLDRANTVVLAIGINDFIQHKKTGINERLQKLVTRLPHKKRLIWSSIMPVRNEYANLTDIYAANQTIKTLCEQRKTCVFIDSWRFLTDDKGNILHHLFLADGIHLNPDGYKLWIAALKEGLKQPIYPLI
jgi:lysophospholipase L1-like esterase